MHGFVSLLLSLPVSSIADIIKYWGDAMEAVGFDLGETLIYYNNVPQSWKDLYNQALIKVLQELGVTMSDRFLHKGEAVLSRYNTRMNPRDVEVTDIEIFRDLLHTWGLSEQYGPQAINVFFDFFQRECKLYEETIPLLKALKERNIRIGILTDVPYGMNKTFVLRDIEPMKDYVDAVITSVEVGYRKPRPEGFIKLAEELKTETNQMIYVGNERKDVTGANRTGIRSVLINRGEQNVCWNQDISIKNLTEILRLL